MRFRDIPSSIVLSGSITEPVTRTEAKTHLRESGTAQDTAIDALIATARQQLERDTGRAIPQQTLTLYLDSFPCDRIEIRRPPVISLTSIVYTATDGTANTAWTDYQSDLTREPAVIIPAYGYVWPTARSDTLKAVTVTASVGYATVPEIYKHAIKLLIGHWYEHREAVTEASAGLRETPLAYQRLMSLLGWGNYE